MTAIETDGLTKVYGESVVALEDLDLTVETGEVYGFLGPNGAGKSTTINMLLDFVPPTSGDARVLDRDVRSESLSIRERIGILPEGAKPYDRLTGREHVEFAMECKGVDGDTNAILSRVGLAGDDADRPAGEYSKGMAQRMGLGMALVGEPELLILDEPSTGLDPTGMAEMRDLIREEAASGTAVFFSSHHLGEVEAVCDRIGILNHGSLVADGDVDVLRDQFAGQCEITVRLDSPPTDEFDSASIEGVVDATVEDATVTVTCRDSSVRANVVEYFNERSTIVDITSEEMSLETMFEQFTSLDDGEVAEGGSTNSEVER